MYYTVCQAAARGGIETNAAPGIAGKSRSIHGNPDRSPDVMSTRPCEKIRARGCRTAFGLRRAGTQRRWLAAASRRATGAKRQPETLQRKAGNSTSIHDA